MKRLLSLFSTLAIVLSLASCDGAQPRDVIYRAKILNYSTITYSYYTSDATYLVSIDSAYRSSDTVLWNNDRYVLLERVK